MIRLHIRFVWIYLYWFASLAKVRYMDVSVNVQFSPTWYEIDSISSYWIRSDLKRTIFYTTSTIGYRNPVFAAVANFLYRKLSRTSTAKVISRSNIFSTSNVFNLITYQARFKRSIHYKKVRPYVQYVSRHLAPTIYYKSKCCFIFSLHSLVEIIWNSVSPFNEQCS